MPRQLLRLTESRKSDSFDDQKTASEIAGSEVSSENHQQFLEFVISQIKRIIHGNRAGDWHNDPASVFSEDASLYALLNRSAQDDDQVKDIIPEGETFLVKENHQHVTWNKFTIEGEYKIDGISVVLD